eukprot:6473412-Amphidinium_carterae.2
MAVVKGGTTPCNEAQRTTQAHARTGTRAAAKTHSLGHDGSSEGILSHTQISIAERHIIAHSSWMWSALKPNLVAVFPLGVAIYIVGTRCGSSASTIEQRRCVSSA